MANQTVELRIKQQRCHCAAAVHVSQITGNMVNTALDLTSTHTGDQSWMLSPSECAGIFLAVSDIAYIN